MKITLENEDRVELRDTPWGWLVCLAAVSSLFGYGVWSGAIPGDGFPWLFVFLPPLALVLFLYYFERLEVVFDRKRDHVQITRKRLTRTHQADYKLSALKKIGTTCTYDSDGGTCRIALYVEGQDEPIPLTFYETNSPSMHEVEERLQLWLRRVLP